jgi:hypothetical protein
MLSTDPRKRWYHPVRDQLSLAGARAISSSNMHTRLQIWTCAAVISPNAALHKRTAEPKVLRLTENQLDKCGAFALATMFVPCTGSVQENLCGRRRDVGGRRVWFP